MAAIATGNAVEGAGQGFMGLLDALIESSVPLLAAVNGVAVGSGLHPPRPLRPRPRRRRRTPAGALRRAGRPRRGGQQPLVPRRHGLAAGGAGAAHLGLGHAPRSWSSSAWPCGRARPGRVARRDRRRWRRASPPTPGRATRAITSLMRAARRDAVVEANRREQAAFADAARAARQRTEPWPSSPARLRPVLTVRLGITAALTDLDADAGGTGPRRRGARLRLALPPRAHPPARARGRPAGARRGGAPRRLQALPRPARRPVHRRRGHRAHRARHRDPAGGTARPHRPGQAGGDARPPLGRPGHARGRLRLESRRGRGPRGRLRPTATPSCASTWLPWRPSGRPTRPSTTASSSTSSPPGPGRSRSSSPGCAPSIGGGADRRRACAAVAEYADGWIPIGGSGLAEAIPRLHAWPRRRGATPPRSASSPSGPSPTRASSSTTPVWASPRWCCGSGPATKPPCGPSSRRWPPCVPFAATLVQP